MNGARDIDTRPLRERIAYHTTGPNRARDMHELLCLVFPPKLHPRAWRYAANGGPPGCAMALGAACRRMGIVLPQRRRLRHSRN